MMSLGHNELNSTENGPQGFNLLFSIVADNGLVLNRWQAITWIYDVTFQWHHVVSRGQRYFFLFFLNQRKHNIYVTIYG